MDASSILLLAATEGGKNGVFGGMDVLGILRTGLSGLILLLLYLGYHLLKGEQKEDKPREKILRTIRFFLITCLISAVIVGGFDLARLFVADGLAPKKRIKVTNAVLLQESTMANPTNRIEARPSSVYNYMQSSGLKAVAVIENASTGKDGNLHVETEIQLINLGSRAGIVTKGPLVKARGITGTGLTGSSNETAAIEKILGPLDGKGVLIFNFEQRPYFGSGFYELRIRVNDRISERSDHYVIENIQYSDPPPQQMQMPFPLPGGMPFVPPPPLRK
jgi:hypothetical protein